MSLLFRAALLLLLAGCASAPRETLDGDTLHHAGLHLSVTKPAGWRFQTPKEKRDARSAVTYKNKTIDSGVKLNAFPPRIVISKYAEPRAEFNPSVTIDRYPLEDYRFKDGLWVAGQVLRGRKYVLDKVEVLEGVYGASVNKKFSGYYRIRYKLEVKVGGPFLIEERVWAVSTGLMTYLIVAQGSQDGKDAAVAEIEAIVASIKFDAP